MQKAKPGSRKTQETSLSANNYTRELLEACCVWNSMLAAPSDGYSRCSLCVTCYDIRVFNDCRKNYFVLSFSFVLNLQFYHILYNFTICFT